jgi:hypothetical protein
VSNNLTIESPNFEKINKEAGQHTSDAVGLLWAALNDTRKTERVDFRQARDIMAPRVLSLNQTAAVDNLDLAGASVVEFTGTVGINFSGIKAPETGRTRIVTVYVTGSGGVTLLHDSTSESANRFTMTTGANRLLSTQDGLILIYLSGKWREVNY